ncbi:MAG: hypothetical protein QE488_06340 [Acidovorax sp.]|nr:hypothetical protein [Acidovorax sp.]
MSNAATLTRELRFEAPAGELAADAPIPCTIATNGPVVRYGVMEVLDCTPEGVDLSRAPLPLIVAHNTSELSIGLVENLRAVGDRVTGEVRFSSSPEAQQVRADVLAGIHPSLSVGYVLLDEGTPIEGGSIYRWKPHEVSIVPVPADPAAGFFRSLTHTLTNMNTSTLNRADAEIVQLCKRHGVADLATGLIENRATLEQANRAVLDELARRDLAQGGHLNVSRSINAGEDERSLIVNTLVARMGGKPEGDVIRAADTAGLAIRALELSGQRVGTGESRDRIIQRALQGTSDFKALLGSAVGRVLQAAYAEAPAPLKAVARESNLPDFREKSMVRLGGAPSLEKVNEHGEFTSGAVADEVNAWRLVTYGRIIGLTRQAMVNDDLQGFATLMQKFGQAAARREADELVSVLLNPQQVDGDDLFDAARSTAITKKLTLVGLGEAVKALRAQKDIDGGLILQEPATIVVPSALEMTARQLVASFVAAKAGDVQPYTLGVVVEPRLDAASAAAWYLVAGNQTALEYGYLDGEQGVQITQREGFEVDGMQLKARLDFGCGWVAPIGWVKSSGTVD